MTVAALRRLLAEIDTQGGADAARLDQLALNQPAPTTRSGAVRAWALRTGVDCPRIGRVPDRIVDAWRAAGAPSP